MARRWTRWEEDRLRDSLRRGGYPEAYRVLEKRFTRTAIQQKVARMGFDVPSMDTRVARVTPLDWSVRAGITEGAARAVMNADPLTVKRGRYLLTPACHLQAYINRRPTDVEELKHPGLITAQEAAARIGVTPKTFRMHYAPRIREVRIECATKYNSRTHLYPLDAVTDLARQRAA